MSIYPSDLTLRQPLTLSAIVPVLLCFYAQAVLAILPNTFIFNLLLLPFILWKALGCATGYDLAPVATKMIRLQSKDEPNGINILLVAQMFSISLKSIEWTFIKEPFKRYEPRKCEQDPLIERRRMSIATILLDAFDLMINVRGIGWSWSSNPFPHLGIPPPSIAFVVVKMALLLAVFDVSYYNFQRLCPSFNNPTGIGLFDPSLPLVPRTTLAASCGILGGVLAYATIDGAYHLAMLIGRVIFRQPASAWPPAFHRPWMSTSIQEFWTFRWHQFARHLFIVFGARPGGKLFGRPGAVMGAFAVSAVLHHIALWAVGNGTEFVTAGGFFLVMGVGVLMEGAFTKATGLKVRGWPGWLWTMIWTTLWGTFMVDGWVRHGMMTSPIGPRPGKAVVDAIIALASR